MVLSDSTRSPRVGIVDYDGNGVVNFHGTQQYHGTATTFALEGKYQIDEGCAGKALLQDSDGLVEWRIVLVLSGSQVETLALQPASGGRPMFSFAFSQKKVGPTEPKAGENIVCP